MARRDTKTDRPTSVTYHQDDVTQMEGLDEALHEP